MGKNRIPHIASLILLCGFIFAESGAELYVYGKSYHSNREYGFNETNPGLGLGFYSRGDISSNWFMTGQASVYYDSYRNYAKTITVGPRYVLGDVNNWHVDGTLQVGVIKTGIDNKQLIGFLLPSVSIGYDRYNVHLIYLPENGSGIDKSSVAAAFLRIRLN
jgi:hypothetical protein